MLTTFESENMNIVQGDFMFFIADIITMGVQYGSRTTMCANLTSADAKADRVANLAKYGKSKGLTAGQYDASSL